MTSSWEFAIVCLLLGKILEGESATTIVFNTTVYGYITSPNYPSQYPVNQDIVYDITVHLYNYTVGLYFFNFDLQHSTGCTADYIKISDSKGTGPKHCGQNAPNWAVSDSTTTEIQFVSDVQNGTSVVQGFRAFYVATYQNTYTSLSGIITPPAYPLLTTVGTELFFYITPPAGKWTDLRIDHVAIPNPTNSETCNNENSIELFTTAWKFITKLCGFWDDQLGQNVGAYLYDGITICFYNDMNIAAITDYGFRATFRTLDNDVCKEPYTFSDMNGWFTSPNFGDVYYNIKTCEYRIDATAGYFIRLEFVFYEVEEFGCMYDEVEVYDNTTRINTPCDDISTPEGPYDAYIKMVVVFKSDAVIGMKGFNATYQSLLITTTTTMTTTTTITSTTTTPTTTTSFEICNGVRYDPNTHICCQDNLYANRDMTLGCCRDKRYNKIKKICCDGVILSPEGNVRGCCDGKVYYMGHFQCCRGTIIPKRHTC